MEVIKNFAVSVFRDNWHRPEAIFFLLVLISISCLYAFSDIRISEIDKSTLLLVLVIVFMAFVVWLKFSIVPKNKKGYIGIAIAITPENEEEGRIIKNDLISAIRSAFDSSRCDAKFKIIHIPSWHASQIKDKDDARKFIKKCKAHLLIFGTARQRIVNKKPLHVIEIKQVASHSPINVHRSEIMSKEVSSVIPGRVLVDRENELEGFEITSLWITEAAKYFISVAALVSQNLDLSESLLSDLKSSKFLANTTGVQAIPKLRQLIMLRLSDIYLIRSRAAHQRWRESRSVEDLDEMVYFSERCYQSNPLMSYNYRLGKAMWWFCRHNDVSQAIKEISKCKGNIDGGWRYSLAFLEAFQGNIDQAISLYRKAVKRPVQPNTIFEIEEFIAWILKLSPEKYQLYFCLGFINMKAKNDKVLAIRDFETFLEKYENGKFENAKRLVDNYIPQLKREVESEEQFLS